MFDFIFFDLGSFKFPVEEEFICDLPLLILLCSFS